MAERSPGNSMFYASVDSSADKLSPSSQPSSLSGSNDDCSGSARLCQNG